MNRSGAHGRSFLLRGLEVRYYAANGLRSKVGLRTRGGVRLGAIAIINESWVESAAPNADAAKDGRALVVKGKFAALHVDEAETILFGQCAGSGKEPYAVSCDFARADQPTYRCSCPSRQFPLTFPHARCQSLSEIRCLCLPLLG